MASTSRSSPSGPASTRKVVVLAFDPAAVAANTTAEQAVAVPGVRTTDLIAAVTTSVALTAGLAIVGARVSAADTVQVAFANLTGAAIDQAALDLTFLVGAFST